MDTNNYIDYMVDEEIDVYADNKEKNYPVMKIIAMVLGILGGLGLIYFSIENIFQPYFEQFKMFEQYKEMGNPITFMNILPFYLSMFFVSVLALSPIVGSLLPVKFKSTSLILTMLPVSWQTFDLIPTILSYLSQGAPVSELKVHFIVCISGLLCLTSAILTAVIKSGKKEADDEFEVEYYEEYDDGVEEIKEDIYEEIIEDAKEEAGELFEEVLEEVKEDTEEIKE